ncbi:hypothetical protein EE612_056063 [Oryza sativa]|nr:hypothetical protein EE612_056063 [Oryza sativa]
METRPPPTGVRRLPLRGPPSPVGPTPQLKREKQKPPRARGGARAGVPAHRLHARRRAHADGPVRRGDGGVRPQPPRAAAHRPGAPPPLPEETHRPQGRGA